MPVGRLQRALTSAQRRSHVTESDPVKANFPAAGGDEASRGQTHRNGRAAAEKPRRHATGRAGDICLLCDRSHQVVTIAVM